MGRELVVDAGMGETRIALVEDGRLAEYYVERHTHQRVAGNIYKGRVEDVLPGMQAAFVDVGLERNAFLYVADAIGYTGQHPGLGHEENGEVSAGEAVSKGGGRAASTVTSLPPIDRVVHEGQEIVVQVAKEPIGTKGARIVTHLSIPGRYLVLMPHVDYVGLSRRIEDSDERERLKGIAKHVRPRNMGLIVRTAAVGRSERELKADVRFLMRVWRRIAAKAKRAKAPLLLYKDHDLLYRLVRDTFNDEFDALWVESGDEQREVLDLLQGLAPKLKNRVRVHDGDQSLFAERGIEEEVRHALDRRVWLDCGGYLVIDRTEALTSIDVNTGRYTGTTNLADTVLKTNLEAAVEIARQLRLRDIGGIIIVDFIDMDRAEDRDRVVAALQQETQKDKTKTHVLGFTSLGLMEITRKKVREDLALQLQRTCPYCDGTGRILSEETVALEAERKLLQLARERDVEAILMALDPNVAAHVIGGGGANLRHLEAATGKSIYVRGSDDLHIQDIKVIAAGAKELVEKQAFPVREGETVELLVERAHVTNPKDGIARIEGYVVDIEGAGDRIGKRLQVEVTKTFRTYAKGRVVS